MFYFDILHVMNTKWSTRMKLVYTSFIIFFAAAAGLYIFRDTVFPTPSCFDKKQNGYESGIDCGGTCSLRCADEVVPLSVKWSRALPTSSSTYDFVAYISNKNLDNAPKQVDYLFTAYDENGTGFYTQKGTTRVPTDGDFPVIVQNVILSKAPTDLGIEIRSDVPHYKVLEKPTSPTLKMVNTQYEAGAIPRVYSTVVNTKRITFSNLPIRVLLYDSYGNVIGAGETIIPSLGKEESKDIVFTWKRAFSEAPMNIRVFPVLDPFLGSL